MENNSQFNFTYSAQQQKEVEEIRKKYLPVEENKMETLRRLHTVPTRKAQTAALTLGIIGALVMGSGMSLVMTDLGAKLGMAGSLPVLVGVAGGLLGIALVALAYPVYNLVLKTQRKRIAPEILRLTDELLK